MEDRKWRKLDRTYPSNRRDPMGFGKNAIIIGATSDGGLKKGVVRFISELQALEKPVDQALGEHPRAQSTGDDH